MAPKETVDTAVIVRHYEESDGCPHCAFVREAEAYEIDRLLDGGMMVWDIRQETDTRGFCYEHYLGLLAARSRFSAAVMLESHLREIRDRHFRQPAFKTGKNGAAASLDELNHDCFLCRSMAENLRGFEEGVAVLWKRREDFRTLFAQKGRFCLPHYAGLLAAAERELDSRTYRAFAQAAYDGEVKLLDSLTEEARFYCSRFDYRVTGADKDFGNTADILERMCAFLNGKNPKDPRG